MNKKYVFLVLVAGLFSACGGNSSSKTKFDISEYLASEDVSKNYLTVKRDKDGEESRGGYMELVTLNNNTVSIKIDDKLNREFEIKKDNIIKKEPEGNTTRIVSMKRSLSVDDTLYTINNTIKDEPIIINNIIIGTKSVESKKVCTLDSKLDNFSISAIPYKEDILKFKCLKQESVETKIKKEWEGQLQGYASGSVDLDYDLSYFYLKKGVGLIVESDDNCHVIKDGIDQINDNAKECKSKTHIYKMFLY